MRLASDAYEALTVLDAESVDVIVLDLLLPGASGVDLLERLDARGSRIPTLVVSGAESDHALAEAARLAGACAVMTKPVARRLLLAAVMDAPHARV